MDINTRIAEELGVDVRQVRAAVDLLDEGATVPFVARYRKEVTGGLDDTQLRTLEGRLAYLRELEERRQVILNSIREQEKLTPELEAAIVAADTKTVLEDLYLPYKPKRRTKAQIAREAGLEPLADALLTHPEHHPETVAADYVDADKGVADAGAALEGARQILMERFTEDAALTGTLREKIWEDGLLVSTLVEGKAQDGAKFRDYFEYSEALVKIPSHRALALFRGQKEGVLDLDMQVAKDQDAAHGLAEGRVMQAFGIADQGRPADRWLLDTVHQAWKIKLLTRIELDIMQRLRDIAEAEAIEVFARNLKDLLLAAPAGPRVTLGLDPGLRTGVKVAVVDKTGKLLETATIYPHVPKNQWEASLAELAGLVERHAVELIAIGNGTASRETDQLASDLLKRCSGQPLAKVMVSEAGASV